MITKAGLRAFPSTIRGRVLFNIPGPANSFWGFIPRGRVLVGIGDRHGTLLATAEENKVRSIGSKATFNVEYH